MNFLKKNKVDEYGLRDSDQDEMRRVFLAFPELTQVFIFGSRAKGNFKKTSDIDLAINHKKTTKNISALLKTVLEEETNIPYFFDVISLKTITLKELKKHISEYGKAIHKS